MQLILYSKPGCHLCEGLQEKLEQIQALTIELEVRDITTREDWFEAYQYEVPVLCRHNMGREEPFPRPSPRTTVQQLERMLQKYCPEDD
ncbi:MAG TPA: glutaredoxin family protein [Cyanophyceae cyanobacterium]